MKLLLDTHAALWWWADDARLSARARRAIADPKHRVFVSAASAWEIGIKAALGRLHGWPPGARAFHDLMERARFDELSITAAHALRAPGVRLPHRDPFDRMLLAQAELEGLTLVTDDALLREAAEVLW